MADAATSHAQTFRFSTDTIAPHERVSAWRETFGQRVLKLDIESLSRRGAFQASATLWRPPGLGIISGSSTPVRFERRRHLIDSDDVALSIAVSGESRFLMYGREYTLRAGDATLSGAGEGGMNESLDDCRYVVLRVPKGAISATSRPVEDLIGRRIPADTPALRMLRRYLAALDDPETVAAPEAQRLFATHVHDLVMLTLGATRDAAQTTEGAGARAARLAAIKADIEANLSFEGLSVTLLATRHRLPVRYLQRMFETDGTTFTEFVLVRRLDRARRLLGDPRLADRPISVIALDVGFSHISYFNEAFRRRHGETPSAVRAQARPDN